MNTKSKPLVYSCSGCSNVAQLTNQVALELDARNVAQMSCIAGVGGKVKGLVKLAKSGRTILALDGCQLHCVKSCLQGVDIEPDLHLTLTDHGLKKRAYCSEDGDAEESSEVAYWCDHVEQKMTLLGAQNS